MEVNLTKNGEQKTRRVHQLVMEAFAAPRPKARPGSAPPRRQPGEQPLGTRRHRRGDPRGGGNLFYGTHAPRTWPT